MADNFKIRFNGKMNFAEALDDLDIAPLIHNDRTKFRRFKREALQKIGQKLALNVQRNQLSGQALKVKSGKLRKSIKSEVINDSQVSVYSDLYYAKIHDEGGTGFYSVPSRVEHRDTVFKNKVRPYIRTVSAHPKKVVAKKKSFFEREIRRSTPFINQTFTKLIGDFIVSKKK